MSACMWVHTSAHIRACRRTGTSTQAWCVCLSVCTSINYRAENDSADMLPTPILPSIRSEGKERGRRVKNKKTWAGERRRQNTGCSFAQRRRNHEDSTRLSSLQMSRDNEDDGNIFCSSVALVTAGQAASWWLRVGVSCGCPTPSPDSTSSS